MTSLKRKIIAMAVIMSITATTFLFSTFAYFTDSVASGGSTIYTGTTSAELIDSTLIDGAPVDSDTPIRIMPGYEVSKTVSAKNTGTLPVYVRVKLSPEITLADAAKGRESEIDLSLISYDIDSTNWLAHTDGYYYYRVPLTGGNQAPNLFTKVKFSEDMGNLYKDSRILFTTRIEIVQAGGNGESAVDAKGWAEPTSEGGGA